MAETRSTARGKIGSLRWQTYGVNEKKKTQQQTQQMTTLMEYYGGPFRSLVGDNDELLGRDQRAISAFAHGYRGYSDLSRIASGFGPLETMEIVPPPFRSHGIG
ncbi:hypothetical protein FNV43_RR04508 [Rhamnella rubrinervis]|uniref:Uncharacterized protein n=1 Tax=Rhamnella rubrinervis TaxID=2594499 RepID=A0A8K0HKC3_9ROSA|nr:hypothetical protein FNV43_RR04508 [Rhamnella rubrinervis]